MNVTLARWAGMAGLAAASGAVFFALNVSASDLPAIEAGSARETHALALRACAQTYAQHGEMQDCLEDVLTAAVRDRVLGEMKDDVEQVAAKSPRVATSCHTAAHRAGITLASSRDTILEELTRADYPGWVADGCLYGISHGITDAMIISPELMPEWPDIIAACEAAAKDVSGLSYGGCVDGLGHLAWNDTGDEYKAAEHCTGFQMGADVKFCVYSVMMAQFRPLPEFVVHPVPPLRSPQEWVRACKDLTRLGTDAVEGCIAGAGYVYVHAGPVQERSDAILATSTVNLDKAVELGIELVGETVEWCSPLEKVLEGGHSLCVDGALTTLPQAVHESGRIWGPACADETLKLDTCATRRAGVPNPT